MTKKIKKKKIGKTYAVIVLDKSTSMNATREQAIEGYNDQIDEFQLQDKDPNNDVYVSLVTFDTHVVEHLWNEPAAKLQKCSYESYIPSGWTALQDGLGYAINKMMDTKLAPEDAVLFIVISDGDENASKHVSAADLKAKLEECEASGQWTFTYMGCSDANLKAVQEMTGIKAENQAHWSNAQPQDTRRAMRANRNKVKTYMKGRASGQTCSTNFHSDKSGCTADYTQDDGAQMLNDAQKLIVGGTANVAPNVEVSTGTFGTFDVFGQGGQVVDWNLKNFTSDNK